MRHLAAGSLALIVSAATAAPAAAAERQTVGYVETVHLFPGNIPVKAKIDTGAKTSSLDVARLEEFERGGRPWVRFTAVTRRGDEVTLERPVVRISSVRRAGAGVQERPVVRLGVCLGAYFKNAEINLTARPRMNYRMLIGREYLGDRFLIDPAGKFLTTPACPEGELP